MCPPFPTPCSRSLLLACLPARRRGSSTRGVVGGSLLLPQARLSLGRNPEYLAVHDKAAATTPAALVSSYMCVGAGAKLDALFSFIKAHLKAKTVVFFATCSQVRGFGRGGGHWYGPKALPPPPPPPHYRRSRHHHSHHTPPLSISVIADQLLNWGFNGKMHGTPL